MPDTEDKDYWLRHGGLAEDAFLDFCSSKGVLLSLARNPGNRATPWLPEFVLGERVCDLKRQAIPFFSAGRYGLDPRTTVTLNVRDVDDIERKYPDCVVLFWVNWHIRHARTRTGEVIVVRPLHGVWQASSRQVIQMASEAPVHAYQRRQPGGRNAPESYLLNLRDDRFFCVWSSALERKSLQNR